MQKAKELFGLIHKDPFEPVRIYLKDGRMFEVRYKWLIVVGTRFLHIGIPGPDSPEPFYDHIETVPIEGVARVERGSDSVLMTS